MTTITSSKRSSSMPQSKKRKAFEIRRVSILEEEGAHEASDTSAYQHQYMHSGDIVSSSKAKRRRIASVTTNNEPISLTSITLSWSVAKRVSIEPPIVNEPESLELDRSTLTHLPPTTLTTAPPTTLSFGLEEQLRPQKKQAESKHVITPFNSMADLTSLGDHQVTESESSTTSFENTSNFQPSTHSARPHRRSGGRTRKARHVKASQTFSTKQLVCAAVVTILIFIAANVTQHAPIIPNSVYVPGGGFSGFWFILGQLQSIADLHDHQLVCYSAGCLASVAILQDWSVNRTATLALDIKRDWLTGKLKRNQVVPKFVDGLLEDLPQSSRSSSSSSQLVSSTPPEWLSQLQILTTARTGLWGAQTAMHIPTTVEELRQRLLQTTWIPVATGDELWLDDHMDGVFDVTNHPKCTKYVRLAMDWSIYSNLLNPNIGHDLVDWLGKSGREYGVE